MGRSSCSLTFPDCIKLVDEETFTQLLVGFGLIPTVLTGCSFHVWDTMTGKVKVELSDANSQLFNLKRLWIRVSNRNSVVHYIAECNAIFTAISTIFVAHILLPLVPNLQLKVSFLAHQQCRIVGAIKVYFSTVWLKKVNIIC